MNLNEIYKKVIEEKRISSDECLALLNEADLLQLGALADTVRKRFNPENVVTFVADTNPNYTNVCDTECLFCAFWRPEGASDAYTLITARALPALGGRAKPGNRANPARPVATDLQSP